MPRRKPKKPARALAQKQRQSVVVNVGRVPRALRAPRAPRAPPTQPVSHSFSPMIHMPQQDMSSILAAIKALELKQAAVIKDVARVDVGEELQTPLRERQRVGRLVSALPVEEYAVLSDRERLPSSLPEHGILAPDVRGRFPVPTESYEGAGSAYESAVSAYESAEPEPKPVLSGRKFTKKRLVEFVVANGLQREVGNWPQYEHGRTGHYAADLKARLVELGYIG